MSRQRPAWLGDLTVLVCRGCCCGTKRKHRDVNHGAQLDALERAAEMTSGVRVLSVDCLGECSHSNVIVVRYRGADRTTTTWLGELLAPRRTRALCEWIAGGGPRSQPLPASLAFATFVPGRDAACAVERMEDP
jgi:predicted metal-binding protein